MPGILRDHGYRDTGFLDRGKGDEPGMVTHGLGHAHAFVAFALGDAENLRGAGFAGHVVAQPAGDAPRRAALHNVDHGIDDRAPMAGADGFAGRSFLRIGGLEIPSGLDRADQARRYLQTLVGKNRRGAGHLQWRGRHVTLADTGNDGIAGIPLSLAVFPLPVFRGIHTGFLAGDIQPGHLAQAEPSVHEIMQAPDAEMVG